ncbi:MAG: adenylyltransferase/cytidyltransferase family protein [Patescibacteria group bacterium]
MKTVLVFGTFDGLHPGHEFFLKEARKLGDRLVVCIARDTIVEQLKGRPPKRPEIERREMLAETSIVDEVIYGDRQLGSYTIFEHTKPEVIAFGYDQTELKKDLTRWLATQSVKIALVDIPSHNPEFYKSSFLNQPFAGNRSGRHSA